MNLKWLKLIEWARLDHNSVPKTDKYHPSQQLICILICIINPPFFKYFSSLFPPPGHQIIDHWLILSFRFDEIWLDVISEECGPMEIPDKQKSRTVKKQMARLSPLGIAFFHRPTHDLHLTAYPSTHPTPIPNLIHWQC